ncbi:SpoIIE family protein phosphatase, partial [Streptomyces boncukensis]
DGTGDGTAPRLLPDDDEGGPVLGVLPTARWPRHQVPLGRSWSLMLYTDGLVEGRVGPEGSGRERLGQSGMLGIVARRMAEGVRGEALLDALVDDVRTLNGGELTDDVAVLLLDRDERRSAGRLRRRARKGAGTGTGAGTVRRARARGR